jgi:hypothetical protein
MLVEVNGTLANLKMHFPDYAGQGYELAGFIWFQGWNDMINPDYTAEYAANLTHFIRDVRKDLKSPKLPFVIGQMGVDGLKPGDNIKRFKAAQAGVLELPEFKGNVALVKTDLFWDTDAEAVFKKGWRENIDEWNKVGSDYPYHYLGSAKTMLRIGQALGEAVLELRGDGERPDQASAPHWIELNRDEGKWHFARSFILEDTVQSAGLQFAADFCTAAVTMNGQPVLTVEPYCQTQELDITSYLRRGENEVSISATRAPGPAAVALSITLVDRHGKSRTIATDGTWQNAVSLGEVPLELWGLGRRPATISPFDNYEQWQQAKGGQAEKLPKFWTAPGFEVTRLRNAGPDEGSWIALAFDA